MAAFLLDASCVVTTQRSSSDLEFVIVVIIIIVHNRSSFLLLPTSFHLAFLQTLFFPPASELV